MLFAELHPNFINILSSLQKRIAFYGKEEFDIENKNEDIWIQWSNLKLIMSLESCVKSYIDNTILITHMALILEDWSKQNKFSNSKTAQTILYQIKPYLVADFTYLKQEDFNV